MASILRHKEGIIMSAPKFDREKFVLACKDVNKKNGQGSVFTLDSKCSALNIPRWSTGIEQLDDILEGGIPYGRTIEIFGAESHGKTSLAYWLCAQHEASYYIPIEGCVDKDTEYFNGKKWVKMADYSPEDKVLQYNSDGTATLVKPLKYHKLEASHLWHATAKRIDMMVSENHNVVYRTIGTNKLKIKPFCDIRKACERNKEGFCGNVPKTFNYSGEGIPLDENTIRLMVAVFADGAFHKATCNTTQCYMGLKKKRKRERIEMLLNKCHIEYRKKDSFYIFYAPFREKHYPESWYNMNQDQLKIVFDEVKHWDGCQFEVGHLPSFTTVNKNDADFIQFVYTALGYAAYITPRDRKNEKQFIDGRELKNKQISYTVCSGLKSDHASLRKIHIKPVKTIDGYMYCFTMESGMWVMRRNNKIIVTGNTFDAQRAKMFGNKKGQLFVNRAAITGEKCLEAILKVAPSHIPCIVIDSVPCMVTEDQLDPKNITKEGRRGTIASLFSLRYPAVRLAIEENGNTVILINQIRDKMNAMPFGEQTTTPGGHAIKHFNSIQLKVSRVKWIEVPNKDPRNDAMQEKIGMVMNIKVTKSKVSVPLKECKIAMLFHYGFMTIEQAIEKRKEIMAENNQKYRNK